MTSFYGKERQTLYIKRKPVQNIFRAFDFARYIGTPLNLYVVINYTGVTDKRMPYVYAKFMRKYRGWHQRVTAKLYGAPLEPKYVYTVENVSVTPHINWAVFIPKNLHAEFRKKITGWVAKSKGYCDEFDVKVTPVDVKTRYKSLSNYMVKGCEPTFVKHFFLDSLDNEQGAVYGKRAGVSPSLGITRRNNVGYQPRKRNIIKNASKYV